MEPNNTAKMSRILSLLRKQTNGAVTGSMEERGVVWPLNYGVSVPAIREVAAEYAPDHSLARLLYRQQVRELRLAGIMVADPSAVNVAELPFWAAGVVNTEVAEHLSFMFAQSGIIPALLGEWHDADNEWLRYAAVLSATRRMVAQGAADSTAAECVLGAADSLLAADCRPLWRSFASFLNTLYRFSPAHRRQVEGIVDSLNGSVSEAAAYVSGEVYLEPKE